MLYAEIPFLQQQWPSVIAFRADFASLLTAAGVAQPFQEETLSAQTGDSEQPLPLSLQKEGEVFKVLVQVPGADKQSEIGAAKTIRLQFGGVPAKAAPLQATENLVWNGDFSLLDQAGHPVALNLRKEAFNLVEGTGGGRALAFNSTAEKRSNSLHGFAYLNVASWSIPSVIALRAQSPSLQRGRLRLCQFFLTATAKTASPERTQFTCGNQRWLAGRAHDTAARGGCN